ncbi:transcriptional regulator [Photobacterium angustum]|uniref:transcriptional regulator LeuO n=1 Tax=Photobacterium angustum TaxID=661 RepID=UPI0005DEF638|nr:transcriptional regulator LeuO [Photobacterium angustum]KJF94845.1 transcriptional regulator [Photobacterium angustum]KJG06805.1 transcriptional regulator [Photobacterium angustum]PSV89988.1 transcriptional regulator LeuO [Photobacterium angustum]PSW78390.1 transcriptional regulator LeuO [Photobacterium angustum]
MTRKTASVFPAESYSMESTLRSVDLNLLTVFDAVMQEQNITRAAHNLGMSQPAVSNAVARLKVMFNDELFIRHGRGIQPTQRAKQLFGPLRQALQLVKNELPCSIFSPMTSTRTFKLAICSPSDMRFAPQILKEMHKQAPHLRLQLEAEFEAELAQKLRYQEIDFVIDYVRFDEQGFCSTELFSDELVVIASGNHPRLHDSISEAEFNNEMHAVLKTIPEVKGFADHIYNQAHSYNEAYQGASLSNIMYVVGQSELIAVAPRWLAESVADNLHLKVLELPFTNNKISGYLSWHESTQKDKGNIWMRDQLMAICGDLTQ